MNAFSTIKHEIIRAITFFGTGIILCSVAYAAISWPSVPAGETAGGKYSTRLVPSGFIGAFNLATCPSGWNAADGTNGTPDLRGEFIRGVDSGRGLDAGRTLGSPQGDAIRNITGELSANAKILNTFTGAFFVSWGAGAYYGAGGLWYDSYIFFDASKVVPTANENRPRNVAFLYCIKN